MNLIIKCWQRGRKLLPLLVVLGTSSWCSANAAVGRPPALEGNRFLLILETSKTMQRQGEAALAAIDDLLSSEMQGQLRPGDTVGLWTYNNELSAGRLPAQEWTPKNAKEVRERILKYITQQKLEKTGDLQKVLPRIARVVNDSELITVILVNSGDENIAGTPYDSQINEYYQTWRERQRKALKPFVTVFRGERGKLTRYSVCPVPWPIDIPPLPPERAASQLTQNKAAPASAKKVAPRVVKPLIVTGSSRKTDSIETAKPAPLSIPLPQPTVREVPKDPRLETAEEIVARLLAEAGQPQVMTPPLKVVSFHGSSTNRTMLEHTLVSSNGIPNLPPPAAPAMTVSSTSAAPPAKTDEPILPKSAASNTLTAALATTPSPVSESEAVMKAAATAAPSGGFLAHKGIQRAAMALAAGAIVCLLIAARRPKPVYQPSIITRSLERDSR